MFIKKIVCLVFILAVTNIVIYSQNDDNNSNVKREKIKAQKVAFLTQSLDLSVSEAQLFWPVYNEYDKKVEKINIEMRKMFSKEKTDNISDKEAEVLLDKYIDFETQEANLKKEYNSKFKSVLPPKKVLKLYISEREFHRKLLKDLKEKHN
jgi:hypothetical protein